MIVSSNAFLCISTALYKAIFKILVLIHKGTYTTFVKISSEVHTMREIHVIGARQSGRRQYMAQDSQNDLKFLQ